MTRFNISFAGAGRVAGNLCREMHVAGFNILQIVSGNRNSGQPVADLHGAKWSSTLTFDNANNVILVAVPDHRLVEVLSELKAPEDCIVAHTAGSYGLEVFPESIKHPAVFYPLQTFSKERKVTLKDTPILLETQDIESRDVLISLAEAVGARVQVCSADQRRLLHISAVFVCNFTNFMFTRGKELTDKAGLSFDILVPLIMETVAKAIGNGPENSQTGPAVRRDMNTIEKHVDLLSFSPELQELYKELTKSITDYYKLTR